ncbi:MAG: tetratricopeptide repeat protein [Bacteroidales bacterium]|nr:tetratricopeptide repeat protein [Bacteroidales bacterium]
MKNKFLLCILIAIAIGFAGCHREKKDYSNLPKDLAELCMKIDNSPNEAEPYFNRFEYYYDHGQIDNALADILSCIKLDSTQSRYYVGLSDVYFAQKQTDDAEESLQKAIAIDPKNNEAYLKLGELYFHLRMYNECNATLDEALKLKNHNPRVHLIRAFVLKDQGDTLGCVRMLQLVIDQDPKEVKAFLELGYIHQQQHDPLAVTYYQNALAIDPKNEEIIFNLAMTFQEFGDIENAKAQYNQLLKYDKDNIRALFNLGFVSLVYDQKYEEAVAYFTRVIEQKPDYSEALTNRAIALEELGRMGEASEDYKLALKFKPSYQPAIDGLNRLNQSLK